MKNEQSDVAHTQAYYADCDRNKPVTAVAAARTLIKEQMAAVPAPDAIVHDDAPDHIWLQCPHCESGVRTLPKYQKAAAPAQAVDALTDDELLKVMRPHIDEADGGYAADTFPEHVIAAGRAALAAQPQVAPAGEPVDYKLLLAKYIEHVSAEEGTNFIGQLYRREDGMYHGYSDKVSFSDAEMAALCDESIDIAAAPVATAGQECCNHNCNQGRACPYRNQTKNQDDQTNQ